MRQIPLWTRPGIGGRSSRYVLEGFITSSHGHAFRHFQETGHSLAVRVASLTEVPFWREFHLGQCRYPLLPLRRNAPVQLRRRGVGRSDGNPHENGRVGGRQNRGCFGTATRSLISGNESASQSAVPF